MKKTVRAIIAIDEEGNWGIGGSNGYADKLNVTFLDEWNLLDDLSGNVKTFIIELNVETPESEDTCCSECGGCVDSDGEPHAEEPDETYEIEGNF